MRKNLVLTLVCLFVILGAGVGWSEQPANPGAPFATKAANVVVVAKAGGDYTSISAALAAINPTADNPYVVKVMPGVYNESVTMKSYVHLQGAGRDVTRIVWLDDPWYVINCDHIGNAAITGFSIEGVPMRNNESSITISENRISSYYYHSGIENTNASPVITNNIFEQCSTCAIFNDGSSSPIISNNKITGPGCGIHNAVLASPTITNNIIKGTDTGIQNIWGGNKDFLIGDNLIEDNGIGIFNDGSATIKNNVIRNNTTLGVHATRPAKIVGNIITGNGTRGIEAPGSIILYNKITGNGIRDITAYVPANISFNVYDTFEGQPAYGNFNLKSDGTPAPLQ